VLFDSLLQKTELYLIYLLGVLQNNVLDLLKYLITSEVSMASSEVTKLSSLLLTIPTTSMSVEWAFFSLKRAHAYLCSTLTQEKLAELLMTTDCEKKILQNLEKSLNFFGSVMYIFTEQYFCM
jgi:hypothetical protein